jgi:hypothetical protein
MCQLCERIVSSVWKDIAEGQSYRTPDLYKGVDFTIQTKNTNGINIIPQKISITKAAFLSTIHYLRSNNHDIDNPCEIRSSNDRRTAGSLCIAARDKNNNIIVCGVISLMMTYTVTMKDLTPVTCLQ